jgi:hypothetical protein
MDIMMTTFFSDMDRRYFHVAPIILLLIFCLQFLMQLSPSFLRHPVFHRYRRQPTSANIELPSHLHPTWGIRGESCDDVCARFDQRCSVDFFSAINRFVFCEFFMCSILTAFSPTFTAAMYWNSSAVACLDAAKCKFFFALQFLLVIF